MAAGPVGRAASAATDANFAAEVYSYSRARGLFAGIALDGTSISDRPAGPTRKFYDKYDAPASDIINGTLTRNDEATQRFLATISKSTATGSAAAASTAPPASELAAPAPAPAPPASGEAQTYPMEDQSPGQEPK